MKPVVALGVPSVVATLPRLTTATCWTAVACPTVAFWNVVIPG